MEELDLDQQIKTLEQNKKGKIILGIIEIVVILVMSVIFVIYNNSEECTNPNEGKGEIIPFDSKFMSYQGVQNGATVKALCDAVRTNNAQNEGDVRKQIVLTEETAVDPAETDTAGTSAADITTIKSKINVGRRYIVSFGYTSSGSIKNIGIELK